jgi:uncharacterized protein YyaL (SSP411 family)
VGNGTKFPSSLPIGLLLRESRRVENEDALVLARLTLDKMATGGLRDHLAGGFHRYSTEPRWLVPHFEKMLYDNALIAVSYLEAFQATGDLAYARVLIEVLDYVLLEMTDGAGGFYSATDADSLTPEGESEEGYFFTWTREEIEALLGPDQARVPITWFGVSERGPVEGRNVLHTWLEEDVASARLGLSREEFALQLTASRERLLARRTERPPPLRDEKILVAWNGLMISALARAGFTLAEPRYLGAAGRALDFILTSMMQEGRLRRISLDGRPDGPAFLEDYAFLIAGAIDLYEATGEVRWIEASLRLQRIQNEDFGDAIGGGYFRTSKDGEPLLAREKSIDDGAIPSGNSVAASNLSRLAALTGDDAFLSRLTLLYSAFAGSLDRFPAGSAELMKTISDRETGLREIVVIEAKSGTSTEAMLAPLRTTFVPNRVVIRSREGDALRAVAKLLPIVRAKRLIDGRTTAYVCQDRVCQYPTNQPEVFRIQLATPPENAASKRAQAGR